MHRNNIAEKWPGKASGKSYSRSCEGQEGTEMKAARWRTKETSLGISTDTGCVSGEGG